MKSIFASRDFWGKVTQMKSDKIRIKGQGEDSIIKSAGALECFGTSKPLVCPNGKATCN